MNLEDWLSLLEDEPDNELVRFTVAKGLMDQKQWGQATDQFKILVRDNPGYALAWAFLARCQLNQGLKEACRATCNEALPVAKAQKHEIPLEELESILAELDAEF